MSITSTWSVLLPFYYVHYAISKLPYSLVLKRGLVMTFSYEYEYLRRFKFSLIFIWKPKRQRAAEICETPPPKKYHT